MRFSIPNERALNLWLLNEYCLDNDNVLIGLALLIYGVYMTTNNARFSNVGLKLSLSTAKDAIIQHVMQGARGSDSASSFLDSCWQRPIAFVV